MLPPKGGSFMPSRLHDLLAGALIGIQAITLYTAFITVPAERARAEKQQEQIEDMRRELAEATNASTYAVATVIELCRARGHEDCSVKF